MILELSSPTMAQRVEITNPVPPDTVPSQQIVINATTSPSGNAQNTQMISIDPSQLSQLLSFAQQLQQSQQTQQQQQQQQHFSL